MTWPRKQLESVADFRLGKMLDEKKNKGDLRPYLANINVRWGEFELNDLREMRFEDRELETFGLKYGDIVMCEGGEPGRCAIWKDQYPGMMIQKAIHRIRPRAGLDHEFLYYNFLHMGRTGYFAQLFTGATIKHLPREKLALLNIPVPPLPIQKRIACVLSSYDDLIENNRRRMALLEESARLLYQEWFVRLRFPGHEHVRIVDGLPEGWERVQLQSLLNVTHGYAFQGENFSEEPTARILVTPGNFRIGGGIKYDKLKFYDEEGPLEPNYMFEPMDLMLTMTDLSKECDTLGYPAFVPKLDGQSFLHNQRVGKVVPLGLFFPKHFLYCLFCDDRYRHHVVGAATGTSVKHTSPKRILSYMATIPRSGTLIDAFEDFARPSFQQINVLIEATQKLRAARDLLLPRLMSGEVVV